MRLPALAASLSPVPGGRGSQPGHLPVAVDPLEVSLSLVLSVEESQEVLSLVWQEHGAGHLGAAVAL